MEPLNEYYREFNVVMGLRSDPGHLFFNYARPPCSERERARGTASSLASWLGRLTARVRTTRSPPASGARSLTRTVQPACFAMSKVHSHRPVVAVACSVAPTILPTR